MNRYYAEILNESKGRVEFETSSCVDRVISQKQLKRKLEGKEKLTRRRGWKVEVIGGNGELPELRNGL